MEPLHPTKQRLLDVGMAMLLKHGYSDLGVQTLLVEVGIPKGSFYHHFADKEDFALQVIDAYQGNVHALLEATLLSPGRPPFDRIRAFFDGVRAAYAEEGYLGCFLGALGQELSGASDVFRRKIDGCLDEIAAGLRYCLDEACERGELAVGTDTTAMANLLVNAWEGAALRSRLARTSQRLDGVLDFYFSAMSSR